MASEELKLIPDHEQKRVRDNLRRVEDWAKKRLKEEAAIKAEALKWRFLMMGS